MENAHEIIRIQQHSDLFLCQVAVNGIPCVPFWSTAMQRHDLGEDRWIQSLFENAEEMVRQYGRAKDILH